MKLGFKLISAGFLALAAQASLAAPIDFLALDATAYCGQPQQGTSQGCDGSRAISGTPLGSELQLEGDYWWNLAFPVTIGDGTTLSLDVNNLHDGEILGISFLNSFASPTLNQNATFQFAGTQTYGIQDYHLTDTLGFTTPTGWQTLVIDLGAYAALHGSWEGISFFYDNDAASLNGGGEDACQLGDCNEGRFRNADIPEPGTLALLGLGLLGMGFSRRKVVK